jgi:hypothetical protein
MVYPIDSKNRGGSHQKIRSDVYKKHYLSLCVSYNNDAGKQSRDYYTYFAMLATVRSLHTNVSIEAGCGSQHDENTHLLAGRKHRAINEKVHIRHCMLIFILSSFAGAAMTAFFLYHHTKQKLSNDDFQSLVHISDEGDYSVTYPRNFTAPEETFASLAELMLPVWFEASLLSVSIDLTSDVDPSQVQHSRKCLLTVRDLLDVFSPVYSNKNKHWIQLREYFKNGYELAGEFQDLDHGKVAFDADLWQERRQSLLLWKADFQYFVKMHERTVLSFLLHPVPNGCFDHRESHLFWDDEFLADSDQSTPRLGTNYHRLPCGEELATPSLQRLAILQLNKALTYLNTVLLYDTVSSRERQLEFHDLRKELRSFLDEYNLFGFVLFPNAEDEKYQRYDGSSSLPSSIDILIEARKRLGDLNDQWETFDLYRTKDVHREEQDALETEIQTEWDGFKEWTQVWNLSGAMQNLVGLMSNE